MHKKKTLLIELLNFFYFLLILIVLSVDPALIFSVLFAIFPVMLNNKWNVKFNSDK